MSSKKTFKEKLIISNDTSLLSLVRGYLSVLIRQSYLPKEDENGVILAVDEAVANIIEHAYENRRDGIIEVEVEAERDQFKVVIRDYGREFDPASIRDPNIFEHVKLGKKKGLGIFLMRQIMDEVKYVFKDGIQNELTLIKYIAHNNKVSSYE